MLNPLIPLHSAFNRVFFGLRRRVRWSRKGYVEKPAGELKDLPEGRQKRIHQLQKKYGFFFEKQLNRMNALENYNFLDVLDIAVEKLGWKPPKNHVHLDVGSKNFYYALTLSLFFKPKKLTGLEIDGYRIYEDLHSRYDYAQFYIKDLPNTEYLVMDFCNYEGETEHMTLFYPFVTTEPLVDWALPLKVFRPERFFEKVGSSLKQNGFIVMINHGTEEFEVAEKLMTKNGLTLKNHLIQEKPLLVRGEIPVISLWQKIG